MSSSSIDVSSEEHEEYEETKSATNNFVDEDLLTRGSSSSQVYKGQLLQAKELINIEHPAKAVGVDATRSLQHLGEKSSFHHLRFRLADIKLATKHFSKAYLIGTGRYGSVYKAELELIDHLAGKYTSANEGKKKGKFSKRRNIVAIKHITTRSGEVGKQGLIEEIEMLSRYKHPNIVSLLGFCDEVESQIILVHEYMSNGSLDDHIRNTNMMKSITWAQRIRICLDIAHGLLYLHTSTDDKNTMIHRDIKSTNILLDDNWMAKIKDFGLTKVLHEYHLDNIVITNNIAVTQMYLDPEYMSTSKLNIKSDVYSFGVVLIEILCGRVVYDPIYKEYGLPSIARKCFRERTMNTLVDPHIMKADENNFILTSRMDQESLNTFSEIAYECLREAQSERPTMEVVIKELEKALVLQTNNSLNAYQLEEILLATNNFSDENLITKSGLGNVYKGRLTQYRKMDLIVRRLDCKYGQGGELETEISVLSNLKHKNVISALGYCNEDGEKIIIYKQTVHGSLYQYLSDPTIMTWSRRLQICLGVSRALNYIHYDVIHCDINSSKILLDEDWEPKIFGFELSTKYPQSWRHRLLFSGYFDKSNMTPKYDVYSFGVLLFEVLYGMKPMKTEYGVKVELDDIIKHSLREQMDRQSLDKFKKITYNCLSENLVQRPTMDQIVKEIEEVLELQWKHDNLEHAATYEDTSHGLLKMEWLEIPIDKIKLATENFDEKKYSVGVGGFGMVYKATLDVLDIQKLPSMEGKCKEDLPTIPKTVALKRIFQRQGDEQGKQGFVTEIELLTSCKHENIVALLGFSTGDKENILVYEYAANGSLSDYLGGTSKNINLTWAKRIQICLDVAYGINYLHTNMEGKPRIIHRDIKSDNILLDENLNAKVADFGLSKFHFKNQQPSTVVTKIVAGTEYYLDPEYQTSGKYKKESDIYSFGVVLFEILSGRVAYDSTYKEENVKGLAPIARRRFNEKTLKELIDPKIIEEDDDNIVTLNRGPNQESFEAFSHIANQCLAETQAKRPTMEVIIKELRNALNLQGETIVLSRFQHGDILRATEDFSNSLRIGLHEYDVVYRAELLDFENKSLLAFKEKNADHKEWPKTPISVAIKRISTTGGQVKKKFFSEMEMRTHYKHPNIVSLLGFCDEATDEMFLVYEHASKQSLDDYLKNDDAMNNFTWTERLNMCLAVARGLDHLHTKMDSQRWIKHGDLRSANILFSKNSEPKIAYYGISEFLLGNEDEAITKVYWSPEFEKTRTMKIESDIYSFGVILFEIFCGRLAYDSDYIANNDKGLAPIALIRFKDVTIKKMIDPKLLKEGTDVDIFASNSGPNQNSMDTFLKIAHQCLVEDEANRPTMDIIIKELESALNFQKDLIKNLQIPLKDIEVATEKFSQKNLCGSGRYWKAYKGELLHADANTTIVAKRWDNKFEDQFRTELDIQFKHKHKHIIGLVGYCNEMDEKIIVYEHTSKGSLDIYLKHSTLKWMERLRICIDIASALEFLHEGDVILNKVVHRDINSRSIFLNDAWDAKISNFELDSLSPDMKHINDDPQYKQGLLIGKSDIYSFGVILFEILCGGLAWVEGRGGNKSQSLATLARHCYEQEKVDEMVFEGIEKQIVPQSLATFVDIAYECLHEDDYKRPEAIEVAIQLKKALEFQEDFEVWERKLPGEYKEIMQLSDKPDIYHTEKKKDIYKKLYNGILIAKNKVWFKLSENGEANKMISATMFSYENRESHKWRSLRKSRFRAVAQMLDISNLKIQITIDTQFLSPNVAYGVYMVFKFCDPKMFPSTRMYMNMEYRNGAETLHSYFATWRDDEWMMIELYRFVNHKEDVILKFLLDSFSRYYCRSGAIYFEGVEFRAIKNVAREDIKNLGAVQRPTVNEEIFKRSEPDNMDDKTQLYTSIELKGKKHLMLSAKKVLRNSPPKLEPFRFIPSADSRFQDVAELLPEQIFRINYKIETQMLSPFTEYTCYLVFKVSKKSRGLYCPVKVRDLLHRNKKENKIIYFRSPAPLNQHDAFRVPKQREDGWMEVMVWNFNSKYDKLEKNYIPMNLKSVTYEGTMSGLIICGLEFRPT